MTKEDSLTFWVGTAILIVTLGGVMMIIANAS